MGLLTNTDIKYLGGHPELPKPCDVNVSVDKYSKTVSIMGGGLFSLKTIKINIDDIVGISLDEKKRRSAGGALKGALIGGVLTGGIGALAGAAIGGRRREDSNLYLTIRYKNREFDIILKAGKKTDNLYAEIISCFS